jgi:multiple sugar transport system substrate-binding protein
LECVQKQLYLYVWYGHHTGSISTFDGVAVKRKVVERSTFYRTIYFLPVVTTTAVVGIVMRFIFSSYKGLINEVLMKLGILAARWQLWQLMRDHPDVNLDMAPVPSKTGDKSMFNTFMATPEGFVVSSDSKHLDAVGKLIEEAVASPDFYKIYMQKGIALTPMPAVNQDKSNHPWPEFASFVALHEDLMRISPSTAVRNPETAKVYAELGNTDQPKIKPNIGEIVQMYLMGKENDIDGALKSYNEKMNSGLKEAIDKLKQSGVEVSHNDFVFPNWDPYKDYTPEDYKVLE